MTHLPGDFELGEIFATNVFDNPLELGSQSCTSLRRVYPLSRSDLKLTLSPRSQICKSTDGKVANVQKQLRLTADSADEFIPEKPATVLPPQAAYFSGELGLKREVRTN